MKLPLKTVFLRFIIYIVSLAVVLTPHFVSAEEEATTEKAKIDIVSAYERINNQTREFLIGVRFKLSPGWHIYWRNPGDSGAPPEFSWNTLPDASFSKPYWPPPEQINVAHLKNFGYENEVIFPFKVKFEPSPSHPPTLPIDLKIDYLICKEDCIPQSTELHHDIPIGEQAKVSEWDVVLRDLFTRTPGDQIFEVDGSIKNGQLTFKPPIEDSNPLYFFPIEEEVVDLSKPQKTEAQEVVVHLSTTDITTLSGVLTYPGHRAVLLKVKTDSGAAAPADAAGAETQTAGFDFGLFAFLLFNAFLGGLILNAMPCVFPIIGIKILQFTESAGGDRKVLFVHGVAFALGIIISMWLLAGTMLILKAAGQGVGWGFQLQSPLVVFLMICLFSVLAAHLFELVSFGGSLQTAAGRLDRGTGTTGAFLSGVLATVIATPCTGPFMGYALGLAATLPAFQNMLIFTALGVGMAFPYVVLCTFPGAIKLLPRPGVWMVTLKKLMAFPLIATVLWLASVLLQQLGLGGFTWIVWCLSAVTLIGLGLFLQKSFAKPLLAQGGMITCCLLAAVLVYYKALPSTAEDISAWQKFDQAKIEALRKKGVPVFVDFTASWCITCQVNKKNVIETQTIMDAFKEHGVQLFKADWTSQDEKITKALRTLERQGVPVNVLYSGDQKHVFPAILTQAAILDQLEKL